MPTEKEVVEAYRRGVRDGKREAFAGGGYQPTESTPEDLRLPSPPATQPSWTSWRNDVKPLGEPILYSPLLKAMDDIYAKATAQGRVIVDYRLDVDLEADPPTMKLTANTIPEPRA